MERYVELISKEMIKPSFPTGHRLKNYKFSYLDRSLPSIYIPLIFFYENYESKGISTSNYPQILQRLKHSLFATLPSFYPLAGRIKHGSAVECNDSDGVEFIESRAHARINDVARGSGTTEELKQYIPSECTAFGHGRQRPLLVVQVTFFDCGGVALAACISHKIADFSSAMAFLNAWARSSSGNGVLEPQTSRHALGTQPHFPAMRAIPFSLFTRLFEPSSKYMTRRFVFQKEKLELLRKIATASSDSTTKDPTRVELVSAFIWQNFMAAKCKKKLKMHERKVFAALMAVNVRPRTTPAGILDDVFGNCFMSPLAFAGSSRKFHSIVTKLRDSIRRVRGGYITKPVMSRESYMKDLVKLGVLLITRRLEWCYFTSWRGFSMYDLDYGWGKPYCFTTTSMTIKNLVVLVNSKNGYDIEAIVTMKHQELQMIEAQLELLSIKTTFKYI